MFIASAMPAAAQRTPREELEQRHPGVQFREVGDRVNRIYGVPMTRGETADEAVSNWLTLYGEILNNSTEPGGPDLRPFSRFELKRNGRVVYTFRQYMNDLHVESSLVRIMTQDLDGPRVTFVSSGVALRPKGGMPEPKVTAKEALDAAQEHEAGKGMLRWREPSLVAIADWSKVGTGEAHPVWKIVAEHSSDTRTFRVDGVSGIMLSWADDSVHAHGASGTDPVSGSISGKGSPGTKPDGSPSPCENPADTMTLPFARVQAFENSVEVDSVFTDASGNYELEVPESANVVVKTSLAGPGWYVVTYDGNEWTGTTPCPDTEDPLVGATTATAPASNVNLTLNASASAYPTAQVNAHVHMAKTWLYFKDRFEWDSAIPGLDDSIRVAVNLQVAVTNGCGASYRKHGAPCLGDDPLLLFEVANPSPPHPHPACRNTSYSTWVSHEYAHYLLHHMLGFENSPGPSPPPRAGFHEGFADALVMLVQDTHIIGEDFTGCDNHARNLSVGNPQLPICDSSQHLRGMLLGRIWHELRMSSLSLNEVRDLFFAWSLIASPTENAATCQNQNHDQSADSATLLDMLIADDDDGNLANGTPNMDLICAIFSARGIEGTDCPERFGRRCLADCDQSTGIGVLDIFDFLCFQQALVAREPWACNLDRSTGHNVCAVFDFLAFQVLFTRGCP